MVFFLVQHERNNSRRCALTESKERLREDEIKRLKCLGCKYKIEYTHFASLSLNSKTSFFKIALYNDFDDGHFKRERRNEEEEEEEEDELRLGRGEKGVFPRRAARGAVHAALERRRRRRDDEQRTDANNENDVVVIENVVFIGAFLLLPTTGKKI